MLKWYTCRPHFQAPDDNSTDNIVEVLYTTLSIYISMFTIYYNTQSWGTASESLDLMQVVATHTNKVKGR